MLYTIAHFLKDQMPWLWNLIDVVNSQLFSLRYGKRLKSIEGNLIKKYTQKSGYRICRIRDVESLQLADFFARQPKEAYKYFKPHGFDIKSIQTLQKSRSFLAYLLMDDCNNEIVGYCFNRSFFHGKGFRGTMVDINYRGKGIGTIMKKMLNEIGFGIGLRLFTTISKDNVASYRSALSASKVKVLKETKDNELYLEILPD